MGTFGITGLWLVLALVIRHRVGSLLERRHSAKRIERRVSERTERAEPPIRRRPQRASQSVQSGQYERDRANVADHDGDRPPRIVEVFVGAGPNPPSEDECRHHDSSRVDRDGQHDERKSQGPTGKIHRFSYRRRGSADPCRNYAAAKGPSGIRTSPTLG
jgi:hypothetical protein